MRCWCRETLFPNACNERRNDRWLDSGGGDALGGCGCCSTRESFGSPWQSSFEARSLWSFPTTAAVALSSVDWDVAELEQEPSAVNMEAYQSGK